MITNENYVIVKNLFITRKPKRIKFNGISRTVELLQGVTYNGRAFRVRSYSEDFEYYTFPLGEEPIQDVVRKANEKLIEVKPQPEDFELNPKLVVETNAIYILLFKWGITRFRVKVPRTENFKQDFANATAMCEGLYEYCMTSDLEYLVSTLDTTEIVTGSFQNHCVQAFLPEFLTDEQVEEVLRTRKISRSSNHYKLGRHALVGEKKCLS